MQFIQHETITYPFTAHYFGFLADLGPSPVFQANLFSLADNRLIDIQTLVDISDMAQVSNESLITGTVYVNKLHNTLNVGSYRLKLAVQTPSNIIDLIYIPLDIVANDHTFYVSFLGREGLTPEEINYHFRNVVEPGVKNGFELSIGAGSFFYNVSSGVLYTKDGIKIEHQEFSPDAVYIAPAQDFSRVDAICLYYDKDKIDEQGSIRPPQFRVIPGLEDNTDTPPSVPPHYEILAYAMVPAHTSAPQQIVFNNFKLLSSRRPFFGKPALQLGDGTRARFDFAVPYIESTTTIDVDGVKQYRNEDYRELTGTFNRGTIEFIGEVPQAGQEVFLNGQTHAGMFYEHDYTLYTPPASPTPPQPSPYTRSGLVAEFIAENFTELTWPDTTGLTTGFRQDDSLLMPLRGWDGITGSYVYFDGNRYSTMAGASSLNLTQFTVVVKGDLRDSPTSANWMRILSKKNSGAADPDFSLIAINSPTAPELVFMCGGSSSRVTLLPTVPQWTASPFKIVVSRSSSGTMTASYKTTATTVSGSHVGAALSPSSAIWTLAGEDGMSAGSRFEGKLTLVLFYNRILTQPEIDAI